MLKIIYLLLTLTLTGCLKIKCTESCIINFVKNTLVRVYADSSIINNDIYGITPKNRIWTITSRHDNYCNIKNGKKYFYTGVSTELRVNSNNSKIIDTFPLIVTTYDKEKLNKNQKKEKYRIRREKLVIEKIKDSIFKIDKSLIKYFKEHQYIVNYIEKDKWIIKNSPPKTINTIYVGRSCEVQINPINLKILKISLYK
ncbi:hypothetical protein N9901_00180 [Flavobacteriaceae bacterium]|nr:hypothetical protein [Flavobacteriaceae bacterium]